MELDHVLIRGAREHNLRSVNVAIPKKKLVVLTGVSGSGKSSLAFDTLYAEGQRRYVESLSAYARQFLGQMEKPRYDTIRGLSPTISIEQKTTGTNPRSTVGTITEIRRIRPDAPVILVSGYSQKRAEQRFIGKGLNSFLQKPFLPSVLLQTLKNVLEEVRDA